MPNKNRTLRLKKLLIPVVILVIALGGYALWNQLVKSDSTATTQTNDPYDRTVDYGPPTEEERNAGDRAKDELANDEKNAQSGPQPEQKANVVIVDASQYDDTIEVRSFVSNAYEDGVCRYVFKSGSRTVTKESIAFKDARDTQCERLNVNRSEFSIPGDWNMTITYKSGSSPLAGSASQIIKVK